jgi:DNA methylase
VNLEAPGHRQEVLRIDRTPRGFDFHRHIGLYADPTGMIAACEAYRIFTLAVNGSIWINIDDNEGHYLKILCDEIFGRQNFIANIVWQKRTSRENRAATVDRLAARASSPNPLSVRRYAKYLL